MVISFQRLVCGVCVLCVGLQKQECHIALRHFQEILGAAHSQADKGQEEGIWCVCVCVGGGNCVNVARGILCDIIISGPTLIIIHRETAHLNCLIGSDD